MTRLIPPLFTRLYLSMILALVGSVFLTANFGDFLYRDSEIQEFHQDTWEASSYLKQGWEVQSMPPQQFIQAMELWMFPWEVSWQPGLNTPPCEQCSLVATMDDSRIYRLDEDRLLATFPQPEHGGALVLSDWEFEELDEDLLTILEEDPDAAFTLMLFLVAVAAIGAALYLPARQLQKQIRSLSQTQARFGQGEFDARAPVPRSEPIRQLSAGFNQMAEEIARSVQESQVLAQAVPHELRTPLSRIQLANGLLRKQCDTPAQTELLDDIDNYIEDMDQLTQQVLTLFKLNSPQRGPCSGQPDVPVDQVLEQRLQWFQQTGALPVRAFIRPLPPLMVNPTCFRLLLDNLMSNAQRYGHSQVRLTAEPWEQGVRIHVEEDGEGIAPESRKLVFIPFSRLDASRSQATGGLGLGLAIAQAASRRLGAWITVGDSKLGGARFTIELQPRP